MNYRVSVIGLGKIGLPLAVQFASRGLYVTGVDIDANVVKKVNAGEVTFSGEPLLQELLGEAVKSRHLVASTDTPASVSSSDVVVIVVPLLVDKLGSPIFTAIDSATEAVGMGLRPGSLVVFETTLPVGTTRSRFAPLLERASGLTAGKDFYVAFSPERVYSGQVFKNFRQYPKLVGGIDSDSTRKAMEFYAEALEFDETPGLAHPNGVWDLGTAEAAELAKLAETTYRDVNIALANQFARYAERSGIDIYKVIDACNSQPFSHIHQPGVAVGGHCIPVYPHMYMLGDTEASVVMAARSANLGMPSHLLKRIEAEVGSLSGKTVGILGLAYRGGVKEHAFSGAWALVEGIRSRGGFPMVHDPLWSREELETLGLSPFDIGDPCDVIVLQSNHEQYSGLKASDLGGASLIADGRNYLDPKKNWGAKLIQIGKP